MLVLKVALIRLMDVITWFILIRSIMTWFPASMGSKFYEILCELTDPILEPIRKFMYRFNTGPVDFSPMIAIFALIAIKRLIFAFL